MTRPELPTLLPSLPLLRALVGQVLADKAEQGHETSELTSAFDALPDSYDALVWFASQLRDLPIRADWAYQEPNDLADIHAAADPLRVLTIATCDPADVAARTRTAWLARVAGCILGKPFEFDPTLDELRAVLDPVGEWPLRDYVTESTNALLRAPQPQWPELVRERITHVCEDDDISYTVLAMLLLEAHGPTFTGDDLRRLWLRQLPLAATFGPERIQLLAAGVASLGSAAGIAAPAAEADWAGLLNPADEHCGALIRADAYGWANPGNPARAADLAWQDAIATHRRTGVYAAMWVAAACAAALVTDPQDRLAPLEIALSHLPQQSRFATVVRDSLVEVRQADDWLDGYRRLHGRYAAFTHCRVYQEVGTLANTLRFATDVGHGIGLQVCQGNDTDSFGATAGSLLGALLGPAAFDHEHWLARFGDRIHLALATFHEQSLSALATRMARLPEAMVGH